MGRFTSGPEFDIAWGICAHKSPRPVRILKRPILDPFLIKSLLVKATARISLPGGFVVSIRRYSCIHVTARSEYCCMWFVGNREEAHTGSSPQVSPQHAKDVTPSNTPH